MGTSWLERPSMSSGAHVHDHLGDRFVGQFLGREKVSVKLEIRSTVESKPRWNSNRTVACSNN
jgi:hypothetical protein